MLSEFSQNGRSHCLEILCWTWRTETNFLAACANYPDDIHFHVLHGTGINVVGPNNMSRTVEVKTQSHYNRVTCW